MTEPHVHQSKRVPLRCRLFGHRWGMWMGHEWHDAPAGGPYSGMTAGCFPHLNCRRCPARYIDRLPRKRTLEDLVRDA